MGLKVEEKRSAELTEMFMEYLHPALSIIINRAMNVFEIFDFPFYFSINYWRLRSYLGLLNNVSAEIIERRIRQKELSNKAQKHTPDSTGKEKSVSLDMLLQYTEVDKIMSNSDMIDHLHTLLIAVSSIA